MSGKNKEQDTTTYSPAKRKGQTNSTKPSRESKETKKI